MIRSTITVNMLGRAGDPDGEVVDKLLSKGKTMIL